MMDCSVGVMHRKQRTWHISVSLEVIHAIMKTFTWEILSSSSTSFLALSPLCFQHKLSLLCKHSPALWLFFFSARSNLSLQMWPSCNVWLCHTLAHPHGRDTPGIKALKFRYQFNPQGIKHESAVKSRPASSSCSVQTGYVMKPVTDMLLCQTAGVAADGKPINGHTQTQCS